MIVGPSKGEGADRIRVPIEKPIQHVPNDRTVKETTEVQPTSNRLEPKWHVPRRIFIIDQ